MYGPMGVFVVALVGLTGVADVRLDRAKPSHRPIQESSQRPVFDSDDGSGRTFEQDKPRIDRFGVEREQLCRRLHNCVWGVGELQE